MVKVYVVVRSSGSYSDQSWENMGAFSSEEAASKYVSVLEEQVIRLERAQSMLRDHENAWIKHNPHPLRHQFFQSSEEKEYDQLLYKTKRKRSPEDNERIITLTEKSKQFSNAHQKYGQQIIDVRKDFIQSLDFLTDEEKENYQQYQYYNDSSFTIDALPLKD